MCHGLFEERARISVPDPLRGVLYEDQPEYERYVDDYPCVYGSSSDSIPPDSPDLSDDVLAGMTIDYSSIVKKSDSEKTKDIGSDALPLTGSLSTWFDCIQDDVCIVTEGAPTKSGYFAAKPSSSQDALRLVEAAPKSREACKTAAAKEQSYSQHVSEMDDEAPVLIDEKRKRRMSSNRASAQRSRQRKQERLDELEILTAQLRLENATLSRRSKIAEQLAKKLELEKNELAVKVEELMKELDSARHPHAQADSEELSESKDVNSGICHMIDGGLTSPDACIKLEISSEGSPPTVSTFGAKKRNFSSIDMSCGFFQELYDEIDSDQFDANISGVPVLLQEQWYGSFTECLNA